MDGYDGQAGDGAEGGVEYEVVIFFRDVVEGAVLAFTEPAGVGVELLASDLVGDHCLHCRVHLYYVDHKSYGHHSHYFINLLH